MTILQRCVFLCTALFLILAGTLSCAGTSSGKIHALTDAEKDAIMYGNAMKILKLN